MQSLMISIAQGLFFTPTMDGRVLTDGYYALMDRKENKDVPYMVGSTKNNTLVRPYSATPAK